MRLMYSILKGFSNRDLLYIQRLIIEILANKLSRNERFRLFWDNNGYTRNLHIPLINPSRGDLNIYKKYLIGDGNNKKVLLLGSTPLLRGLLSEVGIKNYVIADFSFTTIENSLRALDKLGINIDPENETWLKSNWLDMPLEPESFDCIVGDMVFTQIEPKRQHFFTEKLASLLKQEGRFIGRMQICDTDFDNTVEQRLALLYRLRNRLRDKETQTTSSNKIVEELLQYKTYEETKLEFLRAIIKMISSRVDLELPFISQTKNEVEKNLFKEFSLETSECASDYSAESFPIYLCRKKSSV